MPSTEIEENLAGRRDATECLLGREIPGAKGEKPAPGEASRGCQKLRREPCAAPKTPDDLSRLASALRRHKRSLTHVRDHETELTERKVGLDDGVPAEAEGAGELTGRRELLSRGEPFRLDESAQCCASCR
ncbi:MAG TPA: hypothetical protein VKM54_00830 [Myxococcota bacterium]|nr:hypothetical protein [Myxococcota bacterium]